MVRVSLRTAAGGAPVFCELDSTVRLRDLQQLLCKQFHKAFPSHCAAVVVEGSPHTHFHSQPFLAAAARRDVVDVLVAFERNVEDPFWYDWADRRMGRATVEDEFLFEAAVAAADAEAIEMGCERWAACRRLARKQPS